MRITARSVHLSFTTPPMRGKERPTALFSVMASELWNSTPLILRTLISSYIYVFNLELNRSLRECFRYVSELTRVRRACKYIERAEDVLQGAVVRRPD